MIFYMFLIVTFGSLNNYVSSSQSSSDSPPLTYEEARTLTVSTDTSTSAFYFQQTNYRIKDPKASLKFYGQILGMNLLSKVDFPEKNFTLYFLGYENVDDVPSSGDVDERFKWTLSKKGTLELTHNWGTEKNPDFSYHDGNSDPRGYGHIGIVVPDVDETCQRFEKQGIEFIKKCNEGAMNGIAFIKDPDGYWIEILSNNFSVKACGGR